MKLSPFPLVRCRNIYVLPGVPTLLQAKWRTLKVCCAPQVSLLISSFGGVRICYRPHLVPSCLEQDDEA